METTNWGEDDAVDIDRTEARADLQRGVISGYILDWARELGDASVLDDVAEAATVRPSPFCHCGSLPRACGHPRGDK